MNKTGTEKIWELTEEHDGFLSKISFPYSSQQSMPVPVQKSITLNKNYPGTTIRDTRVTIPVDGAVQFQNCPMINCRIIDARRINIVYKRSLISIF